MSIPGWTETQDRVFSLYGEGKIREALSEADRAAQAFPDRITRTSYWRACLHSLLGASDEAIDILQDALARGGWWSQATLRNEADLAPLRDLTEFQSILRACADMQAAGAGKSRLEPSSSPALLKGEDWRSSPRSSGSLCRAGGSSLWSRLSATSLSSRLTSKLRPTGESGATWSSATRTGSSRHLVTT